MPMEEEETNLGAGGPTPAMNVGREGVPSSQPGAGASSANQENIDTVIEEVTKDAKAEADKITTEEAAKTAAEEAGRAVAEEAESRMAPVDKAEADLAGHVAETQAWFRQAHEELKVAQDLLAECKQELILLQADVEKTQEAAKE
nr:uncharacterized protein LOC109756888 [Aegilops tauschii subsp. strangulata]